MAMPAPNQFPRPSQPPMGGGGWNAHTRACLALGIGLKVQLVKFIFDKGFFLCLAYPPPGTEYHQLPHTEISGEVSKLEGQDSHENRGAEQIRVGHSSFVSQGELGPAALTNKT